jgi:NAD-dependent deacetylase
VTPSHALGTSAYRRIVVLTGAGISVASGLRPYRGTGGLWEEGDAKRYADRATLEAAPQEVWGFFAAARRAVGTAQPNPAHLALARLEASLRDDQRLTIITQNIDSLHQRAGSRNVVELHGSLRATRCRAVGCTYRIEDDQGGTSPDCPRCPVCGDYLRPDVVLFGEGLPGAAEYHAKRALRDCELFLAVGTSGTVSPASSFVRSARYAGARTVLINLEPMTPRNQYFQEELLGPAEELLPNLLAAQE